MSKTPSELLSIKFSVNNLLTVCCNPAHPNFYKPKSEFWAKKGRYLKGKLLCFILFHRLANLGAKFVEDTRANA